MLRLGPKLLASKYAVFDVSYHIFVPLPHSYNYFHSEICSSDHHLLWISFSGELHCPFIQLNTIRMTPTNCFPGRFQLSLVWRPRGFRGFCWKSDSVIVPLDYFWVRGRLVYKKSCCPSELFLFAIQTPISLLSFNNKIQSWDSCFSSRALLLLYWAFHLIDVLDATQIIVPEQWQAQPSDLQLWAAIYHSAPRTFLPRWFHRLRKLLLWRRKI
jgi:hypothetical protein